MKIISIRAIIFIFFALVSACACTEQHRNTGDSANNMNESIGVATMGVDGTISLQLKAESEDGIIGDAYFEYLPSDPEYQNIIDHLGGIKIGEKKPVPPWPDEK
ncbi:hypothetical protein [Teredinibacter sp. KSP-S5-2]|uniref:hypothetical protein n=1 Tax=Teredinibacter sp. KSP-S5-2 TaxID=3034506 RepID=UPI00293513DF|nr:hypothetical protein [Teredinibacter sp. KSP-S5-2]WNO10299.1 hypothetical protein P5V12_03845 [Teredinibacter sp. KSP-S5-2]